MVGGRVPTSGVLPAPRTFVASTRALAVRTLGVLGGEDWNDLSRRLQDMTHRIRRVWTSILAVAPLAAVVLVEAAMRRW